MMVDKRRLAARDINPGEQLTSDYGILGEDEDFECVPEEDTSRTRVKADDYCTSAGLEQVHVQGIGHDYWVDSSMGFTQQQQQDALIKYLLSVNH